MPTFGGGGGGVKAHQLLFAYHLSPIGQILHNAVNRAQATMLISLFTRNTPVVQRGTAVGSTPETHAHKCVHDADGDCAMMVRVFHSLHYVFKCKGPIKIQCTLVLV